MINKGGEEQDKRGGEQGSGCERLLVTMLSQAHSRCATCERDR